VAGREGKKRRKGKKGCPGDITNSARKIKRQNVVLPTYRQQSPAPEASSTRIGGGEEISFANMTQKTDEKKRQKKHTSK